MKRMVLLLSLIELKEMMVFVVKCLKESDWIRIEMFCVKEGIERVDGLREKERACVCRLLK